MDNTLKAFAVVFTAAMMFSAALATSDEEVRAVLGKRRALARALLANVVAVPILAVALAQVSGLKGDPLTGVLLAAICPGAPFGTFMAGRSRQDVAFAVILTCGLTLLALVTVPITSLLLFGPDRMVALPRGAGLALTTVIIVLPVILAHSARRRLSRVLARRIGDAVNWLSFVALLGATVAAFSLRSRGVRLIGWRGSALVLVIVAASIGVGWLFGTSPGMRATLATSTGLRGVGLAFIYAQYSGLGEEVQLGIAAYSVLMLFPNAFFAVWMRRRTGNGATRIKGRQT